MASGMTDDDKDPAHICVKMWENSPGHLDNILRNEDFSVTGIYFGDNDGFYCTQIFAHTLGRANVDTSKEKCLVIAPILSTAESGPLRPEERFSKCMRECMPK
jgi:hypothetical protein